MKLISMTLIAFVCFSNSINANQADSLLILLQEATVSNNKDQLYQIHFDLGEYYGTGGNEEYEKSA